MELRLNETGFIMSLVLSSAASPRRRPLKKPKNFGKNTIVKWSLSFDTWLLLEDPNVNIYVKDSR